jgi:hypothetical protein
MRMGLDVLETGQLRVRREDAEELSAIRDGALSFGELLSMADALERSMKTAAAVMGLPPDVDHGRVDALLASILSNRIIASRRFATTALNRLLSPGSIVAACHGDSDFTPR